MAAKHWSNPKDMAGFNGCDKGIVVNNSLTGGKVPFLPMNGNNVSWYMCGPTVYDVSHVGHARAYLTFDIIRRIMQDYFGYKVNVVMNITDVDDKIIKRVNEQLEKESSEPQSTTTNIDTTVLTRKMENLFWKDMQSLRILPPNAITRVTEYIPEIVVFIEKIITNGFAYEVNGSVYFDTGAFDKNPNHVYGKLCPGMVGNEELLKEGEGALSDFVVEKKSPKDFALWKKSKEKEPFWSSPWGLGRPGWHIECSAMAGDILGSNIDIHSGGIDLRFPHHDNELAQSEACFDCGQWINYFLHAGHLHIHGCKMSKSLKNFISIAEALEIFGADDIRMFYLLHKYDGPLDWSDESLKHAQSEQKQFQTFFQNMQMILRSSGQSMQANQRWDAAEKTLDENFKKITIKVHEALCDNFDTPTVIQLLKELISEVNKCISLREANSTDKNVRVPIVNDVATYVSGILKMFGMGPAKTLGISEEEESGSVNFEQRVAPMLDAFCQFRDKVRSVAIQGKQKEYLELCDWMRNVAAPNVGIQMEDRNDGTSCFKLRNKDELLKELAEAQQQEEDKKLAKEKIKLDQLRAKEEKERKKKEQIERQKQKEDEKKEKAAAAASTSTAE